MSDLLTPTSRTRVKICEVESLDAAWEIGCLGADALGFHVLNGRDPVAAAARFAEIIPHVGTGVESVLLSDIDLSRLRHLLTQVRFGTVQLYQDCDADELARLRADTGVRILKVVSAVGEENVVADHAAFFRRYAGVVDGFLLDSFRRGGTGQVADWDHCAELVRICPLPVFLAGGLTADNVGEAIAKVRPFGVDVESGVSVRLPSGPWVKSMRRVERFIDSVVRADRRRSDVTMATR